MMVADALQTAGAANMPAKNRQMFSDTRLLEKPAPSVRRANKGVAVKNTALRPSVSHSGEPNSGPMAWMQMDEYVSAMS